MNKYDVIVIGGGINGLACASYLSKAGLKVLVLEARGECGAHCDTSEPGIPGFLHNLHATWLITAMSPAMEELELEKYGLELRGTDYAYGKTFLDKKNALLGTEMGDAYKNWEKLSIKDADTLTMAMEVLFDKFDDTLDIIHKLLFTPPSHKVLIDAASIYIDVFRKKGITVSAEEILQMNGFQLLDMLFEDEHIKTMIASMAWIGATPPMHRLVGAVGAGALAPLTGPLISVHQAKGGSHALTHALIKSALSNGVKILTSCPVNKIVIEDGQAAGVVLSGDALFPNERINAKKIVSNVTLVPTFIDLIGEQHIGSEMASYIRGFLYDEQVIFGVYYSLDSQPVWSSADFDPGIQKCFMGYFGGEDSTGLKLYGADLVSGRMHEKIIGNWFVPTLADPTQAPKGCHTSFVWLDVPPMIRQWKGRQMGGMDAWDSIKYELADMVDETYESYAPGFKKSIMDRIIYTPLDMSRNNLSAVRGNWVGGSTIPEQFFENRPLPGILKQGSGSRTFIKNLYLSNSINPYGATWLASGYTAACEVAEDMGVRTQKWWQTKAVLWYLSHIQSIPRNLGVSEKWSRV